MAPKRKRDDEPAEVPSTTRVTRRSTRNASSTKEESANDNPPKATASTKARTKKATTSQKNANEAEPEPPATKKIKTTAKAPAKGKTTKGKKGGRDDDLKEDEAGKKPVTQTNGNKASTSQTTLKPESYTQERALALFNTYADDTDPEVIGPEGLEKLCGDAEISMEGVLPLILAWQLDGKEMGKFTKEEWVKGTSRLRISSTTVLRQSLLDLENLLVLNATPLKLSKNEPYDRTTYWKYAKDPIEAFNKLYSFCFALAKSEQSRNIDMEIVAAIWSVLLAPKFPIMEDVIAFINMRGSYKAVNKDLWNMMLAFCETVKPTLEDYDDNENGGAWPTLLDDFVEWKRGQLSSK